MYANLSSDVLQKFEEYYQLLIKWNEKMNLTAITDRDEVFTKHFLDSVMGAKYLPENAEVCDIGTGAGFPGIPLKIIRPDLNVTLLDGLNKRISFLNEVIAVLGLESIHAHHLRAEEAAAPDKFREQFEYTTARAVAPLNTLCEYALPLTKVGGFFIAYKSGEYKKELDDAQKSLNILGGVLSVVYPFILPDTDIARSFIIIKKIAPTPLKYPRTGNKAKSNPL